MSELVNRLQSSMRAFFEAFLHGNQDTPGLEGLRQQQGAELEITVGRYLPYQGYASNFAGYLLLPRFAIHVDPKLVHFTMTRGGRGIPQFYQAADPTPQDGQARPARWHQYSLVKIHERIDPMIDDEATMTRLLADLPGTAGQPPEPAAPAAWAKALLAMRQADAEFFGRSLEDLTELPAGSPTTDLALYKQIMATFATYTPLSRRDYYPKQIVSVAGRDGLPTGFPEGTTIEYRRINTEELVLEANKNYCLINVPDGWGTGRDRQVGHFKEIVFRLDQVEGGAVTLHPISWATRVIEWAHAPTRDFFDFCFFVTGEQIQDIDLPLPDELLEGANE